MTQALYEVDRMISRFLVVDGILRLELGWLVLFSCSDSGLLLSRKIRKGTKLSSLIPIGYSVVVIFCADESFRGFSPVPPAELLWMSAPHEFRSLGKSRFYHPLLKVRVGYQRLLRT